jgi:hypothetical protein
MPLLLLQVLLIPPGYSPDEADHAARADSVSRGAILGERGEGVGMLGAAGVVTGVWADPAIKEAARAILPDAPKSMTRADLDRLAAVRWGTATFVPSSVAPYFPVFYVPAALAMGVVRSVGLPPLAAIYAGRGAAAMATVLLGTLALLLARRGWVLIFATLMMPASLWFAASLNQDGPMIAAACLAVALLTRAEIGTGGARLLAAVVLACVMGAKPPYLPLVGMVLLPFAGSSARVVGGRLVLAVVMGAAVLGWAWLTVRYVAASVPLPPYQAGPLYAGDAGTIFESADLSAQLGVLTQPVSRLVTVPLASMVDQAPEKLRQMVGGLGLLDIGLPGPMLVAWFVAIAAAVLAAVVDGRGGARADWWGRVLAVLAVLGSVLLIYVSLYLSWTRVGLDHVEGVQGRYLTPLLPFLVLCVPAGLGRPGAARVLAAPAVALAAVGLVFLPVLIVGSLILR